MNSLVGFVLLFLFTGYGTIPYVSSLPTVYEALNSSSVTPFTWTVRNTNGSIVVPAQVPGQVTLDLYRGAIIEEPYVDLNVDNYRWITNETWTYELLFNLSNPSLRQNTVIEFVMEGIDTIATICVNNISIYNSSNMFHTLRIPLQPSQLLQSEVNNVTIQIFSPVLEAYQNKQLCPSLSPGFCPNVSLTSDGLPNVNYIRKQPSSFGWDFNPAFAPSGIWRNLYFVGYDTGIITDVTVVTTPITPSSSLTSWFVNMTVFMRMVPSLVNNGYLWITISNLTNITIPLSTSITNPSYAVSFNFTVDNVQPWWPNGLGSQTIYVANVTYIPPLSVSSTVSSLVFPLSFQKTYIRQPPVNDTYNGNLFYLEINGQPMFTKGSNYVPYDAFDERVTYSRLDAMFQSFRAANYNLVRVWGGGLYPSNTFYELAQRYGILVAQEAMFACAQYPVNTPFLTSVTQEITDNVKRIQKYPIAWWSGNNENEWIYAKVNTPSGTYYGILNYDTVLTVFDSYDGTRPIVGSSPSNGNESSAFPSSPNPNSPVRGDMHEYNYTTNCWDAEDGYPRPRFASEFGWQSYPSFYSWAEYVSPQYWFYWSTVMQNRDHHFSQPPWMILYKNIGENWRIPEPQPPNQTNLFVSSVIHQTMSSSRRNPFDRYHRLGKYALTIASEARRTGSTLSEYTVKNDGTVTLPKDVLGIPYLAQYMLDQWRGNPETRNGFTAGYSSFSDPFEALSNLTVFMDTLWMTQIAQATCVKTEAEKYRRIQNECGNDTLGCTMGSLYWMANDPWPAATKGSLEYNGRWKLLHSYAQRFYAPILVSAWVKPTNTSLVPSPNERSFYLYISSHQSIANRSTHSIPEGCVVVTMFSFSMGYLNNFTYSFSFLSGFGSQAIYAGTLDTVLEQGKCSNVTDCVLTYTVYNASCGTVRNNPSSVVDGYYLDDNYLFLAPLNTVTTLRNPNMTVTNVETAPDLGPNYFRITYELLTVPAILPSIESTYTGYFSTGNNLCRIETNYASTVVYYYQPTPTEPLTITAGQLAASLSVWTLWDVSDLYGT